MQQLIESFLTIPGPQLIGGIIGVLIVCIMWYAIHKWSEDPQYINFSMFYCVTNKDGFPDNAKLREWGAFIISSYGFLWMLWDKQMTEWYFVGYMTVWVGAAAYALKKKIDGNPAPNDPEPSNPDGK